MALTTVDTTALSGTITNAQLAGSIDLTSKVTGALPIANGGTAATTFVAAGLANTPAFHAYLSADQDISDATRTKVAVNTEIYDTDGCYDKDTNYRFLPTTAGKYYIYTSQGLSSTSNTDLKEDQAFIYLNGSETAQGYFNHSASYDQRIDQPTIGIVLDMNGSSDYVEAWCTINVGSGTPRIWGASDQFTYFGAYRIIGA